MMPVMVDAPPLVMLMALLLAIARAAAASTSAVTVRPVNGLVPPNAPVKVASPVPWVLTVNVLAPLTVVLKRMLPLLVVVRAVFAAKVTAALYVWLPLVAMLFAIVEAPVTVKLDVPALRIMVLPLAIVRVAMVWVACRSQIAALLITTSVALFKVPVVLRVPADTKVSPL